MDLQSRRRDIPVVGRHTVGKDALRSGELGKYYANAPIIDAMTVNWLV